MYLFCITAVIVMYLICSLSKIETQLYHINHKCTVIRRRDLANDELLLSHA